MSVTYGFYNSLNGDRIYDAIQMSSLFDGLIIDGVFASIGNCFIVKADSGLTVNLGTGKAWFNHTWTLNDAILPMKAALAEVLLDRIDTLVLEIDSSEASRTNSFKFIKGTPSSSPIAPKLINTETIHQYCIGNIYRPAGSKDILQKDIENKVGSKETPFITGILQVINLTELLGQWEDELDQFVKNEKEDFTNWTNNEKREYKTWFSQIKAELLTEQALLNQWVESEQADFMEWFEHMKNQLSEDAAGKLQLQIDIISSFMQNLDCGSFIDNPRTPIQLHNITTNAHELLMLDGNDVSGGEDSTTLEEHMKNFNAHQNLIIDGNK